MVLRRGPIGRCGGCVRACGSVRLSEQQAAAWKHQRQAGDQAAGRNVWKPDESAHGMEMVYEMSEGLSEHLIMDNLKTELTALHFVWKVDDSTGIPGHDFVRSEERRVGKECICR